MSDSVLPPWRRPIRLHRPWDFPGKNTGAGCHFLLQCRKVKSESEVAQSCPTLSDPMDCSLTGSSNHGIFQAWVLEWGAITRPINFHNSNISSKTVSSTSLFIRWKYTSLWYFQYLWNLKNCFRCKRYPGDLLFHFSAFRFWIWESKIPKFSEKM